MRVVHASASESIWPLGLSIATGVNTLAAINSPRQRRRRRRRCRLAEAAFWLSLGANYKCVQFGPGQPRHFVCVLCVCVCICRKPN